jgi:hypothetical protein
MGRLKRTCYLDRNSQHLVETHLPRLHVLSQRNSVNKFGCDVVQPISLFDFVNSEDVWVI